MSFWQTIKAAAVKSTVSEMYILENGKIKSSPGNTHVVYIVYNLTWQKWQKKRPPPSTLQVAERRQCSVYLCQQTQTPFLGFLFCLSGKKPAGPRYCPYTQCFHINNCICLCDILAHFPFNHSIFSHTTFRLLSLTTNYSRSTT